MSIFNKKDRATGRLGRRIYNSKSLDLVREAIDDGADVNSSYSTDWDYNTMIGWAVERNRADIVTLLLERGATTESEHSLDNQPLLQAANGKRIAAAEALIAGGARLDIKDSEGVTPLIRAAIENAPKMLRLLIDSGANPDAQDRKGNTALHYAASKGYAEIVRQLLDANANPNLPNGNMNTPGDLAAKDYPRIADMIRGVLPQLEAAVPPESDHTEDGWKRTGEGEVARIYEKPGIGYRVTEIFNFNARLYTQIARNLETNAESQSSQAFSQLDDGAAVDVAKAALVKLGGDSLAAIGKKKLPPPELVTP